MNFTSWLHSIQNYVQTRLQLIVPYLITLLITSVLLTIQPGNNWFTRKSIAWSSQPISFAALTFYVRNAPPLVDKSGLDPQFKWWEKYSDKYGRKEKIFLMCFQYEINLIWCENGQNSCEYTSEFAMQNEILLDNFGKQFAFWSVDV